MQGLVDVIRLSPQDETTLTWLERFSAARHGEISPTPLTSRDCNGYWHRIAGMERQA